MLSRPIPNAQFPMPNPYDIALNSKEQLLVFLDRSDGYSTRTKTTGKNWRNSAAN